MKLTKLSILSMTPDPGYIARFTTADETWTYPILGWAVVVRYVDEDYPDVHDTDLEPVVLVDNQYPLPLSTYRLDLADPRSVEVEIIRMDGAL